jgi:hypothetical protein
MHGREVATIPFSTEALKANLLRLEGEWEDYQGRRGRDGIYSYLTAVFELVVWWDQEGKAVNHASRALHLRGHSSIRERNLSRPSFIARLIVKKPMTGPGANGHGCCGTRQNSRTSMNLCSILSSAKVA